MTKLIKLFVASTVVCIVLLGISVAANAETEGYYTYTVSNGAATITKCDTLISGSITIPSTLGGYPVTSIGDSAFWICRSLTEIVIPNGVTNIGGSAFNSCSSLTDITIPNSVTSIDGAAFMGCSSLKKVVIPNGVTSIRGNSFKECGSLKEIVIPNSVTNIGSYAFGCCYSLTEIMIPDSVTSIANYVFYKCSSLTEICIPEGVTVIDQGAFHSCSGLTEIDLPNSVTNIYDNAFNGCVNLETVNFKGRPEVYNKISISIGNTYFKNAKKIYFYNLTVYDLLGNLVEKKFSEENIPLDISDLLKDKTYNLYYDKNKMNRYDKAAPVTSDLVLYADVFESALETITITGRSSFMMGEKITETVHFASAKDVSYMVVDVKYPECLKLNKIIPTDFRYVEKDSEKTENGYTTLSLICQYSDAGTTPKNKTIIPFELEFKVDEYSNIGVNEIEILYTTEYGDAVSNNFTEINNANITITPKLAEKIEITGVGEISKETPYTAAVTPEYTVNKDVLWSVSDSKVATITEDGVLTPIINGTVTIYARTVDGSKLTAEKVISVSSMAKVENLTSNIGEWNSVFRGDVREYTILVPQVCNEIKLTPTFTGGTLRINDSLAPNGREKAVDISSVDTITLTRSGVENYIDGTYTINIERVGLYTYSTISDDRKTINVSLGGIEKGSIVIIAFYKNNKYVSMQKAVYNGSDLTFNTKVDYDFVKVMAWESFTNMCPITNAELVR